MAALSRLWALRRERPGFVALSLAVLGFFLAYPFLDWYLRTGGVAGPFEYYDWGAITAGVARWYRGEPIYVRGEWGFHGSYLYPPVYLLAFVPFVELQAVDAIAAMPFADGTFKASAILWNLTTLGLLWVGLQAVVEQYGLDLDWVDRVLLLWALVGFQPLLYSLKMGQVSAFLAAPLCSALVGLERGRRAAGDGGRLPALASGALTTLGSLVKPFYATAGAHLLVDRRRLAGAVGAGVALLVVSIGVFGLDAHRTYLDVLRWGKGWASTPNPPWLWHAGYYNPLYAVARLWPPIGLIVRALGVLTVVALSLGARGTGADRTTFALGVAAIPFLAPQAHTLDYVALLPAFVVLLAVEFGRGRDGHPWLPVLAVWLLAVQAYGVKLLVHHLPAWLPLRELLVQASPVLQPGLWGNLVLLGLAATRVAGHVPWLPPSAVPTSRGDAGDDEVEPVSASTATRRTDDRP